MKNKRLLIFVFTVLAIIGLGVGYAALTDTLTISSTVGFLNIKDDVITDSNAMVVEWMGIHTERIKVVSQGEREAGKEVKHNASNALINADKDTITGLTIENMCVKGDKVIITYNFKNLATSEFASRVTVSLKINGETVATEGTYDDKFSYSAKVGPSGTGTADSVDLSPNGTGAFTLTIEMTETLFEGFSASFEVKLDAVSIG